MKWETCEGKDLKLPNSWLFPHYYEALNSLFRIENALRVLVYVVMKSTKQENWLTTNLVRDDTGGNGTIASIAKQRMSQQQAFGHIALPISCPLLHLTSGELIRLMLSEGEWPAFKEFFAAKKEMIAAKLDEITVVRNALAHFRPIRTEDNLVVRVNSEHVLARAERQLASMLSEHAPVPTNSSAAWYTSLSALKTPHFKIRMSESACRKCVHVKMFILCPQLTARGKFPWAVVNAGNVNSVAFMRAAQDAVNSVICIHEETRCDPMGYKDGAAFPTMYKELGWIFPVASLDKNAEGIAASIKQAVDATESEMELLKQNPGARGNIVSSVAVRTFSDYTGKEQRPSLSALATPAEEGSPSEYWGDFVWAYSAGDFITTTHRFPWMPVPVSPDPDIPF